ncbi:unnamed protein product [Effrenium voratum]|nr:unnamed protein product [Effrenium voratum]
MVVQTARAAPPQSQFMSGPHGNYVFVGSQCAPSRTPVRQAAPPEVSRVLAEATPVRERDVKRVVYTETKTEVRVTRAPREDVKRAPESKPMPIIRSAETAQVRTNLGAVTARGTDETLGVRAAVRTEAVPEVRRVIHTTASPVTRKEAVYGTVTPESEAKACQRDAHATPLPEKPTVRRIVYTTRPDEANVSQAYDGSLSARYSTSRLPQAAFAQSFAESPEKHSPPKTQPMTEAWRVVKHLCPSCTEKFETLEEVRAHWLEHHQGVKVADTSPRSNETSPKSSPTEAPPEPQKEPEVPEVPEVRVDTMKARVVEVDDQGKPVLVRRQEGPSSRTIVTLEDGRSCAYGEAIVTSLLSQEGQKVESWIQSMDDRSLRGLVNELSERF